MKPSQPGKTSVTHHRGLASIPRRRILLPSNHATPMFVAKVAIDRASFALDGLAFARSIGWAIARKSTVLRRIKHLDPFAHIHREAAAKRLAAVQAEAKVLIEPDVRLQCCIGQQPQFGQAKRAGFVLYRAQ